MSEPHPTAPAETVKTAKPSKPCPDYPLTAHPAGYWCKKIRGKLHYFGPWDDPEGALTRYLERKAALHAGRTPRADADGLTIKGLCNKFLRAKRVSVDCGELAPRSWEDYKDACDRLVAHFGGG